MARPRSEDRRQAILSGATRVIASLGLAAPTAMIAKEAGVSSGALFVYFDTKATLHNELYVALKTEMCAAALSGLPPQNHPREQVQHMWTHWLHWATTFPEKQRTLAHLQVCDDITAESHQIVGSASRSIADLLERSRADGPMRETPLGFVLALTNAIADTTIEAMIRQPAEAEEHSRAAFEAMWRVLAGASVPTTA